MHSFCCISDLKNKQVINICDGRCLGYICDVDVNICDGRIAAIRVPGESHGFSLTRNDGFPIPWEKIERIGDDTILVNVGELKSGNGRDKEKKKKFIWEG